MLWEFLLETLCGIILLLLDADSAPALCGQFAAPHVATPTKLHASSFMGGSLATGWQMPHGEHLDKNHFV